MKYQFITSIVFGVLLISTSTGNAQVNLIVGNANGDVWIRNGSNLEPIAQAGGYGNVSSIVTLPNGNIVVANHSPGYDNSTIWVRTSALNPVIMSTPGIVVWDQLALPNGNLISAISGPGNVELRRGSDLAQLALKGVYGYDFSLLRNGNIISMEASASRVWIYTPSLDTVSSLSGFSSVTAITALANGNFAIGSTTGNMWIMTPSFEMVAFGTGFGGSGANFLSQIVGLSNGNVAIFGGGGQMWIRDARLNPIVHQANYGYVSSAVALPNGAFATAGGGDLGEVKIVSANGSVQAYGAGYGSINEQALATTPWSGFFLAPVPQQLATNPGNGGTLAFGNVRVGASSGSLSLTVDNTGDDDTTLTGTFPTPTSEFSRSGSSSFSVTIGTSSRPYSFAPTDHGFESQNITVTSNGGSSMITLTGTGVGPAFNSSYGPGGFALIDLGEVSVDGSETTTLTLENATTDGNLGALTRLTLRDWSIFGDDAALFSVLDLPFGSTLDSLASLTAHIQFIGDGTPGLKTATLRLGTDQNAALGGFGTNFNFTLQATAVPEPASLSLLALGGVALLGRRRH